MDTFTLAKYLKINCKTKKHITGIVTSTKDVEEGNVLLCIKGKKCNPEDLLTEEIIKKCSMILSDNIDTDFIYISDLKKKAFDILDFYYFNFKHDFKIIGVTGTEGKSSLCDIIYQGLTAQKKKCLLISKEKRHDDIFLSDLTTPTADKIIKAMLKAKDENYEYLIMEVSSISLCEYRLNPRIFDYIFLTNLNQDHLDYHHTLLAYHFSKIKLLLDNKKAQKFIYEKTFNQYKEFLKVKNLTVIKESDIALIKADLHQQIFKYKGQEYKTNLAFCQNVLNIVFLIELFLKLEVFDFDLSAIKMVKGRCDLINARPDIIIDYAHSPKSMELILKQVSKMQYKSVYIIFGAGGNREKEKRKMYGEIALKYADFIIVTNDNPRNEDPYEIAKDITLSNDRFIVIIDRKKALEYALTSLTKDDVLLIIGRGNEDYQEINGELIPFNDYDVTHELLKKLKI